MTSSGVPSSQLHGLGANVIVLRLERASGNDVDPDAQELLQVLEQADVIEKRRTRLEIHEQVQVAVLASLSPGDGTEHGHPMGPALPRDAEDLRAASAQPFQWQHVVGHLSRGIAA